MRAAVLLGFIGALLASRAAAHEYVGWFEHGRAELSPRGYQVAREAALYWMREPMRRRLTVEGHLDVAEEGIPGLDGLRARTMMLELVTQGVNPAAVDIEVHGARRPARPGGLSHEVNRRVVILFDEPPPGEPPPPPRLSHYEMPFVIFQSGSAVVPAEQEIGLRLAMFGYQPGESRVVIQGFADTVGSVEDNHRLSMARAESVARAFARLGVLWSDIELQASGETALSRPTADDVSEPLNRRVQVRVYRRAGVPH
ncbi:OmpA family protein [Brevundimonas sp. AAP58]|uniref:OmpA family protein n=1 Tax=Brevundimonas sp. AAP58 TaxID=1523422 RepID=UPI0006B97B02|nr:OmpA family protein [Brevundimonas sp. AAP58]